jgi:hypothetical protein
LSADTHTLIIRTLVRIIRTSWGKQMIRVDESIQVATNQAGEPVGFSWRNGSYQVITKPVRWFSRKNWWDESARAQRGIGAGVLELEMWRLSASKENASPAQFELIHTEATNSWQLLRIFG